MTKNRQSFGDRRSIVDMFSLKRGGIRCSDIGCLFVNQRTKQGQFKSFRQVKLTIRSREYAVPDGFFLRQVVQVKGYSLCPHASSLSADDRDIEPWMYVAKTRVGRNGTSLISLGSRCCLPVGWSCAADFLARLAATYNVNYLSLGIQKRFLATSA